MTRLRRPVDPASDRSPLWCASQAAWSDGQTAFGASESWLRRWRDRHRCLWRPRPRAGGRRPSGQGSAQPSRRARIRRAWCRKYRTGRDTRRRFSTRVLDALSASKCGAPVERRQTTVSRQPRAPPPSSSTEPRPRQGRILCRPRPASASESATSPNSRSGRTNSGASGPATHDTLSQRPRL